MAKKFKTFSDFTEDRNQPVAIIMRGASGSGKSTTAKNMMRKFGGTDPNRHIFSTDDFFIQDVRAERLKSNEGDDQYWDELERETYRANWNASALGKAHDWNHERFRQAVNQRITPVVVDNTNSTAREMRNYVDYAEKNGYKVIVQEPNSPWWNDHKHMLLDKGKYDKELDAFANFLAGNHEGMKKQYGVDGNTHGVPSNVIRNMLQRWHPEMTPDKIMNRD